MRSSRERWRAPLPAAQLGQPGPELGVESRSPPSNPGLLGLPWDLGRGHIKSAPSPTAEQGTGRPALSGVKPREERASFSTAISLSDSGLLKIDQKIIIIKKKEKSEKESKHEGTVGGGGGRAVKTLGRNQ